SGLAGGTGHCGSEFGREHRHGAVRIRIIDRIPASARAVRSESAIRLRPPVARKSPSSWVLDREEPDSTAAANSVTEAARGPNCVSRVDDCPGLTFTCGDLLSRLGKRRGGSRGAAGMD